MHTGKELKAHRAEKGRLSCDSDAPQVGSARSDWTRVVKVKNSDLCHLQRTLIGFYNRDEKCLQRGTDWVFR